MSGQRLDFGRRNRSAGGPRIRVMAGILAVVALATWAVHGHGPDAPEPVVAADEVVVEVRGDVPRPGFHPVGAPATVSAAVAAAGGSLHADDRRVLPPGASVVVTDGAARVGVMENTLVVGVPVDVNAATVAALEALPGVGPARAAAIVEEREAAGPFASVDDLARVRGIGPATVDALRPFVRVTD